MPLLRWLLRISTTLAFLLSLDILFIERDIQVYSVMNADEAFTASTPYCVMPVTKINGAPIGNGQTGPVVRRLLAAWRNA